MGRSGAAHALASVLTDLKRRKGRSFEALAKRLAVSKSALHRYTSGEVVPAKFSIVELWARECGATPAEIAELHRLWRTATAEQESRLAGSEPAATPTTTAAAAEPADGGQVGFRTSGRLRRGWLVAAAFVAVAGIVATSIALARSGKAEEPKSTPMSAAADDGSSGRCEARAGVRHVDARHSGHIWRTDYVCPNTTGVALYDEPGGTRKIAVMETGRSWFTCWTSGPDRAAGGSQVWYYTRGDRGEPGAEAWDGWGFVPAEHVLLPAHPAPSMPDCWFVPDAPASATTPPRKA